MSKNFKFIDIEIDFVLAKATLTDQDALELIRIIMCGIEAYVVW